MMIGLEPNGQLDKELLTVPEAAEILGIGRSRMYEMVQRHDVPSVKLSPRRIRVRTEDLKAYVAKCRRD